MHTAILVRAGPSIKAGQRQRMRAWYDDILRHEPTFALYVSVDCSNHSGALAYLTQVIPIDRVHAAIDRVVLAHYARSWTMRSPIVQTSGPPGRIFHVEFVSYWASMVARWRFKYLWVVEEDVGITGSLSSLLLHYMRQQADLVTVYQPVNIATSTRPGPRGRAWPFWHVVTPAYARMFPPRTRFATWEFFIRLSRPLVEKAHVLSLGDGMSAWSEQVYPTIAMSYPKQQFQTLALDHAHVGVAKPNARINETMWKEAQRAVRVGAPCSPSPGKVFHALKW